MRRLFTFTILILSFCSYVSAQQKKESKSVESKITSIRLDETKPSVYISFVRTEKLEPKRSFDSGNYIFLRLYNNTRWAIWLEASSPSEEYGDASMYYEVRRKNEVLSGSLYCHVCSTIPLKSGDSLLFVIPKEDLSEGNHIKIGFSFDWQNRDDVFAGREIETAVTFYASDLPKVKTDN